MLVLSRKEGEEIVVGIGNRAILIRIVDCRRGRVRIGVAAPSDVTVHRLEIWNRRTEWKGSVGGTSAARRIQFHTEAP